MIIIEKELKENIKMNINKVKINNNNNNNKIKNSVWLRCKNNMNKKCQDNKIRNKIIKITIIIFRSKKLKKRFKNKKAIKFKKIW